MEQERENEVFDVEYDGIRGGNEEQTIGKESLKEEFDKANSPDYQNAVNENRVNTRLLKNLKEKGFMDFGFGKNIFNPTTGQEYDGFNRAVLNNYLQNTHIFDGRFMTEKQIEASGMYSLKPGAKPVTLILKERVDVATGKPIHRGEELSKMSAEERDDFYKNHTQQKNTIFYVYNGSQINNLEKFQPWDKRDRSKEALEKNKLVNYLENKGVGRNELQDKSVVQLVGAAIEKRFENQPFVPEIQKKICGEMLLQRIKSRTRLSQGENFKFIGQNDIADIEKHFKENRTSISQAYNNVCSMDAQLQRSRGMKREQPLESFRQENNIADHKSQLPDQRQREARQNLVKTEGVKVKEILKAAAHKDYSPEL